MAAKKPLDRNAVRSAVAKNMATVRKFGIRRIGIFGSINRGEGREDSDVDILIEFEKGHETYGNLAGLYFYLEGLLGRKIDLVTTGALSPYLAKSILDEVEYIEAAS